MKRESSMNTGAVDAIVEDLCERIANMTANGAKPTRETIRNVAAALLGESDPGKKAAGRLLATALEAGDRPLANVG
jgi:hypothetical protein